MLYLKCIFLLIFSTFFLEIGCDFNLTIVQISDFHSHWFEFNEHENICSDAESRDGKCFGGFARLLTKVKELREKEKNVLVLSSGEFFYGSSHNPLHGWKIASHLLPKLKLDAMSLSNHDFGRGILELSAYLYKLEFPVLCANIEAIDSSFLHSGINKSTVLNVNNEKIGIVGYLHPHAIKKSRPAVSVKLYPEIPAIQKEVQEMQGRGVNKIIALGHSGYYTDLEIAKQVNGVDVVIGGDSDIVMGKTDGEKADAKYPHVNENDMNRTLVLHIPQHGKYVGVLRLHFDDDGKVIGEDGQLVLLDSSVPQDEETLLFLRNASAILEGVAEDYRIPDRDEVLATAEATLNGRAGSCRMEECSLGNFIADAILYMFDKYHQEQSNSSYVDAVVINSGMIRYSIQAGDVTVRELTHALFLGDLLNVVKLNGSELKEMMEHSVEVYDFTGITASGAFLQVSGLRVVYDLNQPPGHRVKSLMIRRNNKKSYGAVRSNKYYYIAMPDFLRKGNDGFRRYSKAANDTFGEDDITILINYLRDTEIIKPTIDRRISFYDKNFSTSMTTKQEYRATAADATEGDTPQNKREEFSSKSDNESLDKNLSQTTMANEFELRAVFEIINSSLSDLERSFLELVISEPEKESENISSIDALEDHLKVKVKLFLKVETISMHSPDDIFPDYIERYRDNGERFDKGTSNNSSDFLPRNVTESLVKLDIKKEQTAQNHNSESIGLDGPSRKSKELIDESSRTDEELTSELTIADRTDRTRNGEPSRTDEEPIGEFSRTDEELTDELTRAKEKRSGEPSRTAYELNGKPTRINEELNGKPSYTDEDFNGKPSRMDEVPNGELHKVYVAQENKAKKNNDESLRTDKQPRGLIKNNTLQNNAEKHTGEHSKSVTGSLIITDLTLEETTQRTSTEPYKTDTSRKHDVEPPNSTDAVQQYADGTSKIPIPLTDSDVKDAHSIHEILVYSIVQSIVEKIKEKLPKYKKLGNEAAYN